MIRTELIQAYAGTIYKMFQKLLVQLIFITAVLVSCNNSVDNNVNSNNQSRNAKSGNLKSNEKNTSSAKSKNQKVKKVTYYLENSESMFGYVNGSTGYVNVVSELAEKPEFVEENTLRDFYFINGGASVKIIPIGTTPAALRSKLNTSGFNCGDITKSNLNTMFQIALTNAGGDNISILISDCIYDIGDKTNPLSSLSMEGRETRSLFIKRLTTGNIQTIMIKLQSDFRGNYFYTSKSGRIMLNQSRPYYILIFGESGLLNKYFPEKYIAEKLRGYESMARFFKIDNIKIPYQATTQKAFGSFKFDRGNNNRLTNAIPDRNGRGFQFSIACDFSSLPFSEQYLVSNQNYSSTDNYKITEIKKPEKKIHEITNFNPSHLITVFASKSPFGILEIKLMNVIPPWIGNSDTNIETNILTDNTHTFGFKFLTEAIIEAYEYKNKKQDIVNLKVEIIK